MEEENRMDIALSVHELLYLKLLTCYSALLWQSDSVTVEV